jgi:hypothetical protein
MKKAAYHSSLRNTYVPLEGGSPTLHRTQSLPTAYPDSAPRSAYLLVVDKLERAMGFEPTTPTLASEMLWSYNGLHQ